MVTRGLPVGKGRPLKDCHTGLGLGHISNRDCLCTICTEQECWEQLPTTLPEQLLIFFVRRPFTLRHLQERASLLTHQSKISSLTSSDDFSRSSLGE